MNKERKNNDDDFRMINTGINALDKTFLFDKRVEMLVSIFNDVILFMEQHTSLSREEILEKINSKIYEIELADGYEDNPYGIGCVDNIFCILSINEKILTEEPKVIYEFIRHEVTHMLSGEMVKKFWRKRTTLVSGYLREAVLEFSAERPVKENESFNEAVVEMFAYQDEEYRNENVFGYTIYTNQNLNEGYYCINSNIIRQMMLAKGVDKATLFKGLYDRKTAKKVEGKFNKKIFKQLSKNMDSISQGISDYWKLDDASGDEPNRQEKIDEKKKDIINKIKEAERTVIDKILVPNLRGLSPEKREKLLSEYDKFLVCERDYFRQRTNYMAISHPNKHKDTSWIQRVEVNPKEILDRQGEMDEPNIPNNNKTDKEL